MVFFMVQEFRKLGDIVDILDPQKSANLVIDIQNHYCSEKGVATQKGHDVSHTRNLASRISEVLNYC